MKTFLKLPNEDIFKLANEDRGFILLRVCVCLEGAGVRREVGWWYVFCGGTIRCI